MIMLHVVSLPVDSEDDVKLRASKKCKSGEDTIAQGFSQSWTPAIGMAIGVTNWKVIC